MELGLGWLGPSVSMFLAGHHPLSLAQNLERLWGFPERLSHLLVGISVLQAFSFQLLLWCFPVCIDSHSLHPGFYPLVAILQGPVCLSKCATHTGSDPLLRYNL